MQIPKSDHELMYHGLPTWGWFLAFRRRYYCPRGIHMLSEVQGFGGSPIRVNSLDNDTIQAAVDSMDFNENPEDHYLECDACEIYVGVAYVRTEEQMLAQIDKEFEERAKAHEA